MHKSLPIFIIIFLILFIVILVRLYLKLFFRKIIDLESLNLPELMDKTQQPLFTLLGDVYRHRRFQAHSMARFTFYKDFFLIRNMGEFIVFIKEDIVYVERFTLILNNYLKIHHNAKNISSELIIGFFWPKDVYQVIKVLKSLNIKVIE